MTEAAMTLAAISLEFTVDLHFKGGNRAIKLSLNSFLQDQPWILNKAVDFKLKNCQSHAIQTSN